MESAEIERDARPVDIDERAFAFACRVVKLYEAERKSVGAKHTILAQLLRSGTSVGSNLAEARGGQSKADFISKSRIALKEARESHYWLRILKECALIPPRRISSLAKEANELVAILTSILKRATTSPNRG